MELGVVAVWWLTYAALILAAWPLIGWVLRDAPDRGASIAVPLALVIVGIPTLWIGQVSFDVGILVGFILLATLSVFGWRRWLDETRSIPWREFAATLAVFTVAFCFMVVIRAAAPGIYPGGGEKFLDFGILQSLLRAETLPPVDMWFAGERVRYYYGGHLLVAILAKVNGTPGVLATGPALSGYYAMQVTAVYGLAQTIVATREGTESSSRLSLETQIAIPLLAGGLGFWLYGVGLALILFPTAFGLLVVSSTPTRRAGILSAFAFGIASNLLTPLRLGARRLSPEFVSWAMQAFGPSRDLDAVVTPETFSYWTASRVIPNTINEFPMFAFRNGDMHAHMMSPAFLLLLVGILLGYTRSNAVERRRRLLLLATMVPIAASTIPVNTWSFPTTLGLVALGVAAAREPLWSLHPRTDDWNPPRFISEVGRVGSGIGTAAIIGGLAVLVVWPFVANVLLGGPEGRSLGVFPTRSGLGPFVIVHGVFLLSFAAYFIRRGTRNLRGVVAGLAAIPILIVAAWQFNLVGLLLVGPLIVAGWWLCRTERTGFEAVLIVAGGGLVVLVEFVHLVDTAAPERFNTVFKVYSQVWAIWAVALGVVLSTLMESPQPRVWRGRLAELSPGDGSPGRAVASFLVVFIVVSTSMYGGLAVQQHVGGASEYSLDAMTYAHTHHPDEAAAIEWLGDRPGQPHLVEKPCVEVYRWCNPASSLTGIPTLVGWGHHQSVYHGREAVQSRQVAVGILYGTDDPYSRAVLLRSYDVEYIYVGPRERAEYDTMDYATEPGIDVAYANDAVVIYHVDQSALTNSSGA